MVERFRENEAIEWENVRIRTEYEPPLAIVILAVGVWGAILGGIIVSVLS